MGHPPNHAQPNANANANAAADIARRVNGLTAFADYPIDHLVEDADRLARQLANSRLTKTQVRKVFGFVRRIEARSRLHPDSVRAEALLTRPKLAYMAARDAASRPLCDAWTPCLGKIQTAEDMRVFMRFAEATVAYFEAWSRNN